MKALLKFQMFFVVLILASFSYGEVGSTHRMNEASQSVLQSISYKVMPENKAWNQYIQTVNMSELQPACRPVRWMPEPGVPVHSKILLIHGFTACPQQYFEWAQQITKKGVAVYLFLLPGHGRLKLASGQDDYSQLPSQGDISKYQQIAQVMNQVAIADDLPSAIGGLSAGGAVALHAALTAEVPYDQVLAMTPFLEIADHWKRILGPVLEAVPMISNKQISWGEGCHQEALRGRAGYCDFTVSQILTAQKFGQSVVGESKPLPAQTTVQIVGVEKDPAAYTQTIQAVARKLGYKQGQNKFNTQVGLCFYPFGANHSLISRFDSPDENKFWLEGLLQRANDLIENSILFNSSHDSPLEKGLPLCDVP